MTTGSMANQFLVTSSSSQHATLIESTSLLEIRSHVCDHDNLLHTTIMKSLFFRHSDKMIKRLESAGLGYFVSATETQHKLGKLIYSIIRIIL